MNKDFPILKQKINGKNLVYLDSAATSLKPKQVIEAVADCCRSYLANVHRGIYQLSEKSTQEYESVRGKVAKLINASPDEVIFTKNTTEAINLVAKVWGEANITKGSKIILSVMEHHSNLVPWQELMRQQVTGNRQQRVVLDINDKGELDLSDLDNKLKGVSLVAITHVSNVLGTINPVKEITQKAHQVGALVLVDGAQAVPHMKVDVKKLGCDFYVFSGHKMLGPSGVGVLWVKKEIADKLPPFLTGGGMVSEVTLEKTSFAEAPHKFEAGTPNIEGVIGLGAAIDYLQKLGMDKVRQHEKALTEYALKKLSKIDGLTIYGPKEEEKRGGIIAFNLAGIHPHDVASLLDKDGIAVRAGFHCAMPVHQRLGINGSTRVSFYIYNSMEDIDKLVQSLEKIKRKLSFRVK